MLLEVSSNTSRHSIERQCRLLRPNLRSRWPAAQRLKQ